eukprot:TRINITY_DN47794_c0_g1_i1.p1 TRINITY_DN47794_c0_g1~~TRINITY_DN47794_c0_g1_i1.p1  ORF type:complete len:248 (+),score=82.95 TRINITY_DN47794_c0_g1_i1:82-825(+)
MASDEVFKAKVKHNKDKFDVELRPSMTVGQIKEQVQEHTRIPAGAMKLTAAKIGLLEDDAAGAAALGINAKTVFMVTGTPAEEAAKAQKRPASASAMDLDGAAEAAPEVSLAEEREHLKILKKGPPEAAEFVGDKSVGSRPLPVEQGTRTPYLKGCVVNKSGAQLRLRLLSKEQELVIATESNQQKLPFGAIKSIRSQPVTIEGGKWDAWHVVEIQLHQSAQSKIHLYWFPCQFVKNFKDIILGFGF